MQDFITMLSLLSAKLVEQQECLTGRDRTITDMEDQIDGLRTTLARREENHAHSMEEMERKYWEERTRAGDLQLKLNEALRLAPDVDAKAESYMQTTGQHLTIQVDGKLVPAKIEAIKGVRYLTGWGLKEAKDYVEEWFAKHVKKSA